MEILNIDEENLHIFWTTWEISMKFFGKKQGFTLSLEDKFLEEPQEGRLNWPWIHISSLSCWGLLQAPEGCFKEKKKCLQQMLLLWNFSQIKNLNDKNWSWRRHLQSLRFSFLRHHKGFFIKMIWIRNFEDRLAPNSLKNMVSYTFSW